MAKNIVIGMGGTGAKLMESFVHLCASGVGPAEEVTVGLIEQDIANGNTGRTVSTLSNYMAARKLLRDGNGRVLPPDCNFLRSRLVPLAAREDLVSDLVWKPNARLNDTLGSVIDFPQMSGPSAELVRCFFSDAPAGSGDAELNMTLDEGYRARPHIGATAFLYAVDGAPWWQQLEQKIQAATDQDLRVFLFASGFGGTGAAFFPTVAKEVRRIARERNISRLRVSGVLMTPYFGFPPAPGAANVARAEHMVQQTKAALADYHDMVLRGDVFDALYLVGNDPAAHIPKFAPGNRNQKNAPLAPEMIGALAAMRDLREPVTAGGVTQVMQMSRNAEHELVWDDLPNVADNLTVQQALGNLLRFCWQWHFNFRPALDTDSVRTAKSEAWHRNLLGKDAGDDLNVKIIGAVDRVVEDTLFYAIGMAALSDTANQDQPFIKLWSAACVGQYDARDAEKEPKIHDRMRSVDDFNKLIVLQSGGQASAPSASQVFRAVSDRPETRVPEGASRLVATLYRHCAVHSDNRGQ